MAIQRRSVDKVGSGLRYGVLALGAVLFLVPFYLLLRNGLSTEADITSPDWTLFPSSLQWGNIAELFDSRSVPMARSLFNSALIAVSQTVLVLVVSGMAGYGLARIPYRWSYVVLYATVATLLIPAAV